ncbi:MAG: integrin alpha [Planctomycetota bacterium]
MTIRSLRTLLLLVSAAVPALGAAVQATEEGGAAADRQTGALRHVQLLGVADGKVRFATSTLGGIALHERALGDEVLLAEPKAFLATEFPVLPMWTWRERVPWRLVERGDDAWLVAAHHRASEVVVLRFPSGEPVARIPEADALEDARFAGDRIEVLARRGEVIAFARVDPESGATETSVLVDAGSKYAGAAFVAGPSVDGGNQPPTAATVATYENGALVVYFVDLQNRDLRRVPTEIVQRRRTALRVSARQHCDDRIAAIGLPLHDGERGQVVLVALDPPHVSPCWPHGRRREDRNVIGRDVLFGQAVAVTADADGDDRPDALVGAPYGFASDHVDLVSPARSRSIRRFDLISFLHRVGTAVSVSPCGRHVLASGGHAGYPEDHRLGGFAALIDVERRGRIAATFLAPGR